jgi:trehalose 6-phosphate synthase
MSDADRKAAETGRFAKLGNPYADSTNFGARPGERGGLLTSPTAQGTGQFSVVGSTTAPDSFSGLSIEAVIIDPEVYRLAYDVVSNATIWFVHHHLFDLTRRPRFNHLFDEAWEAYRAFNRVFAERLAEVAAPGATVIAHDYHLGLVPALATEIRPDLRIVHFSHTPFGDPGVFRALPTAIGAELLGGMASATACGFHTERWRNAFEACCADAGIEPCKTFVSPLIPDSAGLRRRASAPGFSESGQSVRDLVGECKVIVRVDRMEPSKNLLRGIWAFDELLAGNPDLVGNVVLLTLAYPSRETLPEYLAYAAEVDHLVKLVNARWGNPNWTPVVLDVADNSDRSLAALGIYDVLMVNPVRDGLNLVAKEGPLVNTTGGVLVLSREAGSHAELSDHVIGVNPFDVSETAEAIKKALGMPVEDRHRHNTELRRIITRRPVGSWLQDQLDAAAG